MARLSGVYKHLRLLGVLFKISFQDDAAYRGEFWIRLLSMFYSLGTVAVGLWILFSNTERIAGWSLEEVIVLIGAYHTVAGVTRTVLSPSFQRIVQEVREGTLDFVLTKPANSQFLVSFRQMYVAAALESLMGLAVSAYGVARLQGSVGLYAAFAFPIALACGLVVLYSFWLILMTCVFWFIRIDNLTQIFWALFDAGRFPLEIYPGWLRAVLTYLVPVAVVTTFPAQGIAGRLTPGSLALFALMAAAALFLASRFWRYGVSHYTSASS